MISAISGCQKSWLLSRTPCVVTTRFVLWLLKIAIVAQSGVSLRAFSAWRYRWSGESPSSPMWFSYLGSSFSAKHLAKVSKVISSPRSFILRRMRPLSSGLSSGESPHQPGNSRTKSSSVPKARSTSFDQPRYGSAWCTPTPSARSKPSFSENSAFRQPRSVSTSVSPSNRWLL